MLDPKQKKLIIVGIVLCIIFVISITFSTINIGSDKILQNVKIQYINVARMTQADAKEMLEGKFEEKKKNMEESQKELKRLKVIDDAKSYIEANNMYVFEQKMHAIISIAAKALNTAQDLYDPENEQISCISSKQDLSFEDYGLYNYILKKIKKYYIDNDIDDLLEESYYEEYPSDDTVRVKFGK